jgi:hypothetical protein
VLQSVNVDRKQTCVVVNGHVAVRAFRFVLPGGNKPENVEYIIYKRDTVKSTIFWKSWYSEVGIATDCGLDQRGGRIPLASIIFSSP